MKIYLFITVIIHIIIINTENMRNMRKSDVFDVCDHSYMLLWQHHNCISENTTIHQRDAKGKEKMYILISFEFELNCPQRHLYILEIGRGKYFKSNFIYMKENIFFNVFFFSFCLFTGRHCSSGIFCFISYQLLFMEFK